jgi:hypothetical protein
MTNFEITLSKQDLAGFLNDNDSWMDQYRAELETQLATDGNTANVKIDGNALSDKIVFDGESDSEEVEIVYAVMDRMVNDWSWLKQ